MKIWLIGMICALMLTGCREQDNQRQNSIDEQQHRIASLEKQLAEMEKQFRILQGELFTEVDALKTDSAAAIKAMEDTVAANNQNIHENRRRLENLSIKQEAGLVRSRQEEEQAAHTIPQQTIIPITTHKQTTAAEVPAIEILNVTGTSVVTGEEMIPELVETEEMVKDEFGEEVPLKVRREKTVYHYDYEVHFTARNSSAEPVTFTARAGRGEAPFTLAPGTTEQHLAVRSLRGSDLKITCNGQSRRYRVIYQ